VARNAISLRASALFFPSAGTMNDQPPSSAEVCLPAGYGIKVMP
jgi:hypothetical protein